MRRPLPIKGRFRRNRTSTKNQEATFDERFKGIDNRFAQSDDRLKRIEDRIDRIDAHLERVDD